LERSFREVLGSAFDDELRALVEHEEWFLPTVSASHLFELWVRQSLQSKADYNWVLGWVRVTDRKFIASKLGIARERLIGLDPQNLGSLVLRAAGFPVAHLEGPAYFSATWRSLEIDVDEGNDAKAATNSRQVAERLLKTLLFTYCNIGHLNVLLETLQNPGELRLPRRLGEVIKADDPPKALAIALREDGWADLGFLALGVRKLSARLEDQGRTHITGKPLLLLSSAEAEAFSALGTALQAYAHDKPSLTEKRADTLRSALQGIASTTDGINARDVFPDQMLVTENCVDLVGPVFRGITSNGSTLTLVSERAPPLGQTILYLPALKRDLSVCHWCDCPWPPLSDGAPTRAA